VNASTVRVTDAAGTSVTIPVGSAGTKIEFADATRTLSGSSAGIILGNQSVTATPLALAAGTAPPAVESYTLSVNAPTVTEGDTGSKTLSYKLTLSTAPTSAVTVSYETLDTGTATANDDFVPAAGTVTFAAGQTVAFVSITVLGDTTVEAPETIKLNLSGSKLVAAVEATGTIVDNEVAAVDPTSFTVSASDIAINNQIQNANPVSIAVGASGSKTVTIQSDGVTSDGGFIVSGAAANITVNAGLQGDTITVVSNGNNVVNAGAGAGDDTVTIVGSGTNQINVGAGTDSVTGGSGNDTIVFASGDFKADDTVDGGDGIDTVVISGNGNVADAGNLANVERLVLNGTTLSISDADLADLIEAGLIQIDGEPSSSKITITADAGSIIDLTGLNLFGIQQLIVDADGGAATLKLSASQIAAIGTIVETAGDTLTVETSVAGYQALGAKAPGAAVELVDTAANLLAAGNTISGVTATLGDSSVAQAQQALASGLTVSYTLVDTAANLALAPVSVFDSATSVTVSGTATAAQANTILASLEESESDFDADNVTLNVVDSASNVSSYLDDTIAADSVSAGTETLTVAQAAALYTVNPDATYKIKDTPDALAEAADTAAMNNATEITATGALTVDQVVEINTGDVDIKAGYALVDLLAELTGAPTPVISAAGNITVTDPVSVQEALAVEALTNKGTTSYDVSDTVTRLLAASSVVVANASSVEATESLVTVSQIKSLVSKFGAAKIDDDTLVISDTLANLLQLTGANGTGALSVASDIEFSQATNASVGTAQQIISLAALTGDAMPSGYVVTDSAANLASALTAANVDLLAGADEINVTGTPSVAAIAALNAALEESDGLTSVTEGYVLSDTAAALSDADASDIVDAADTVNVTGAASVEQLDAIEDLTDVNDGFTLTDSADNITSAAGLGYADQAAVINVTGTATLEDMVEIVDAFNSNGPDAVLGRDIVYTISDTAAAFDGATPDELKILNGATSARLVDTADAIFAGALTTTERNVADLIIVKDGLDEIDSLTTGNLAEVDRLEIDEDLAMSDAEVVNDLAALKPTTYTVVDTYAHLTDETPSADEVTFLRNATEVTVDGDVLTVEEFNALDALTNGAILSNIEDTVANLSAADAVTAINSADVVSLTGDTNANVTQAATLATRLGADHAIIGQLDVVDNAANIQAAAASLVENVNSFVVSDNGLITGDVALVSKVYGVDGSSYGNYAIVDTAEHILNADEDLVNFAQSVTVTGTVNAAEADQLAELTAMGPITFNIRDAAVDVAGSTGLDAAVNITVTGTATVEEADTINAATNSGTTSYAISDSAENLATEDEDEVAAIEAATGTVTATDAATADEADIIAALSKAVVFDILDDATSVAGSTGLGEAKNIVTTDEASADEAAIILAAANSGTTTLDSVSGSAAKVAALTLGANDTITTLAVTGTATVAQAVAIAAKDTGDNIGELTFATISGSYADLKANIATVLLADDVTVLGPLTVAQAAELVDLLAAITGDLSYSIADSLNNIMADTSPDGTVDNDALFEGVSVTVTDAALTIAQATVLTGVGDGDTTFVYTIADNDANIVAAINSADDDVVSVVANATSVIAANGSPLTLEVIDNELSIVGTRASLASLSSVLQDAPKVYEVSVAELAANSDFYVDLDANASYRVTDTIANLTGGNALLPGAVALVATDAATVAQAEALTNVGAGETVYSLTDTADAISDAVGGTLVDGAVNVTVTTALTFAEAAALEAEGYSGTLTYNISDDADNFADSSVDSLDAAVNITVTGTLTDPADAAALLAAENTGATSIEEVEGESGDLAALVVGSNDTIDAFTPTNAATVEELSAMSARAGSITAYSLSDTGENLAAASEAQLDGAIDLTADGTVTVAEAAIIDAATNEGETTFNILDTAAHILAASAALLGRDADGIIVIEDTTVLAAVATQLRALDAANDGEDDGPEFVIIQNGGSNADEYVISDSVANLTATANAAAVGDSPDVRVTGEITVAQANLVRNAADSDLTPRYNVADTYSRLVAGLAATQGATNVRITNVVTVSQANLADGNFQAVDVIMNIRDTASAVANGITNGSFGIDEAENITLTTSATVVEARILSGEAKLVGGYAIADSAENVADAINRANGDVLANRDTVLGASSITLTSAATVVEALGDRATEARGLFTVAGLSYAIEDSAAAILAALDSSDVAGIENATSVGTDDELSIEDAITLTALANFGGSDGAGAYALLDTYANILAADTDLLDDAVSVRATSEGGEAETIDMSGLSRGVYVSANDEDDIVFGSEFADTLDGGTGADDLTGGSGRDAFKVDSNRGGDAPYTDSSDGILDRITDFTLATAGWAGSAANNDVAEFQALSVGGSQADILDINLFNGTISVTLSVVADVDGLVEDGVLDIGDSTFAEAVTLADTTANDNGKALLFEHGGNSYVFVQNGNRDVLVELSAVTGVNGLSLLADSGTVGGAGYVIIG
jgi:hypothetical protein